LGLKGCLEKFDDLAGTFSRNSDGKDREKVVREVERMIRKMEKRKSPDWKVKRAKTYQKIMQASVPNVSDYVASEKIRMEKMLKENDISVEKKKDFQIRLNILKSFE
jgi:hypothetical protein